MKESRTIWLDENSLTEILSRDDRSLINLNVFKKDPASTTYDCHKPVKVKVTFEYEVVD